LAVAAIFSVFESAPQFPQGKIAGVAVNAAQQGFLDFPLVPDTKLVLLPVSRNAEKPPEISAKAVLIRDVASRATILERNSAEKLPIASLTKLMTALVVVETSSLDEEVEIVSSDLNTAAYRLNFNPGETLTVRDLLTGMLVSSANDAALALARHTKGSIEEFVKAMNEKTRDLRMFATSFQNPIGLDHARQYSTAADLSLLVEEFMNHTELLDIVKMKAATVSTISGRQKSRLYTTNKLLLDRADVIGLKTGFTAEAGGSLIILVHREKEHAPIEYYSIMLGSSDREGETDLLMKWIDDNFIWK